MAKRNARSPGTPGYTSDFPTVLSRWLDKHAVLLGGIVGVRKLGPGEQRSLDGLLDVWEVKKARLSWELWELVVRNAGDDPEELLLEAVTAEQLAFARYAFWGIGDDPYGSLRVVK